MKYATSSQAMNIVRKWKRGLILGTKVCHYMPK
uniref:Uncharacterized protein n=1 Tax=Rhizophora mucronata TaxID=61149 RepID=A0A2P2P0H0_RHIMU